MVIIILYNVIMLHLGWKPLSAKKAINIAQVNFDTLTAYHLIKENYLKTI